MSFGLMFVPDRAKCLKEIYRVLKPGGFAYISVWKELNFHTFAHEVLEEINDGEMMPEFPINPLALKKINAVERLAIDNTPFEVFSHELLTYDFKLGTAKETADSLKILTQSSLDTLESEGKDAHYKFYKIVEREVTARGWKTDEGV